MTIVLPPVTVIEESIFLIVGPLHPVPGRASDVPFELRQVELKTSPVLRTVTEPPLGGDGGGEQ